MYTELTQGTPAKLSLLSVSEPNSLALRSLAPVSLTTLPSLACSPVPVQLSTGLPPKALATGRRVVVGGACVSGLGVPAADHTRALASSERGAVAVSAGQGTWNIGWRGEEDMER